MFLSQSYYPSPKIIRQNVSYCIILKLGGSRDISSILRECSVGISKEELMYMYDTATKKKFDVLIINMEKSNEQRYRHTFLNYFKM